MKSSLPLWLLALALIAAFVALGRWQLRRGDEKQALLDTTARVLHERRALSLSELSQQDDTALAWVAGRGEFAVAPALLLDNQRRGDAVGVHAFRIFRPEAGRALLVDLGWLPLPGDRRLPSVPRPEGMQALRGLLMPPPSAGFALGPAFVVEPGRNWLLTRVDLPALEQGLKLDLAPRVLRLDPALSIGYARDLDVLPNTLPPERHRGYAVQWFGLALATAVAALILHFRRRPA